MKKLSTVSLFIFGVIVTAILVAGLVFYQNNKNSSTGETVVVPSQELVNNVIKNTNPSNGSLLLDMTEISKHNKSTDCWLLISGKIYDITGYFGSHPAGNDIMAQTCGTDATAAYATRNPNATTSGSKIKHSSKARSMLNNYYLGDLGQSIGK